MWGLAVMKKTNKQQVNKQWSGANKAIPPLDNQQREEFGKGFDFHAEQDKEGKGKAKNKPESERTAWD